ncbi:MAG: hypothetical protein Q8N18_01745 [Opitutaceae bacterium]|nr:hypothetical protein [Opitutaceae bacterium]
MSPRYEFAISGEASRFLFGSTARIRAKAEDAFDFLSRHPFTEGDFQEGAPSGRTLEVKLFGNLIVTYWVDHAAREIRVVNCEVVEGSR